VSVADYLLVPQTYTTSLSQQNYVATFTFIPLEAAASTEVNSAVFITSGAQFKHTTPPSSALATLPSPVNFATVRMGVASPSVPGGGITRVTFTLSNVGAPAGQDVTLNSLLLNNTAGVSIVAGSSTLTTTSASGRRLASTNTTTADPAVGTGSVQTLVWSDIAVPAGSVVTLSASVNVSATACVSGAGYIYSTLIDATAATNDSATDVVCFDTSFPSPTATASRTPSASVTASNSASGTAVSVVRQGWGLCTVGGLIGTGRQSRQDAAPRQLGRLRGPAGVV